MNTETPERPKTRAPRTIVVAPAGVVAVEPRRFVKLPLAEAITGFTVSAMNTKIKRRVWLEGHEFIYAPDGSILIDLEGYDRWAAGQRRVG